jgi:hypothetical protein
MLSFHSSLRHSGLVVLIVLCLSALTAVSVFASGLALPSLATTVYGNPDAAVNGKLVVGSTTVGNKSFTVLGVIDFLGVGTVHNYFSQGAGNNMQINTNVDEANAVGDATKSQWKLVLGSSLDQFSIRRSPASGTYNEDALFFIDGSTGNVGIATVDTANGASIPFTPQARLHVQTASGSAVLGYASATTGTNNGVYGESASTGGFGVHGYASATTGNTSGVYGESASTGGFGVRGDAVATTGSNVGVYGLSDSTSGHGVYGYALATTGTNYGVFGRSNSPSGTGVSGYDFATTGTNYGVYGQSSSSIGYGIYGSAISTTGTDCGVFGTTASASGYGMYGYASATSGATRAVAAMNDSISGIAVYAVASATTGSNIGVFGSSLSTDGYAGYFSGNVQVVGTLIKSAGSFKIDDPLDPAHKYLQHSFVESPDMMNVYNGNVTLDDQGQAVVTMPDWFQALNQDFRYQLTPIGAFAPLYVADKIKDNRFTIAGGEPGMEVSWQVTGIRHDPYAEAHRIQVVVDKPASEQGTYLFPALYAQPASKSLDYAQQSKLGLGNPPEPPQAAPGAPEMPPPQ